MVTLLNPCPSITQADLCVMDDQYPKLVPEILDENRQVFSVEFPWSSGVDGDMLVLGPGDEKPCPAELARTIIRQVGELGLVMITPAKDPKREKERRIQQIIQGLRAALTFYSSNGILRLQKLRRGQAWSPEEMEQLQHQHRAYYLNQRRHDLLKALSDKLGKELIAIQSKRAAA
jgi:hypothetical protein